MPVRSCCPCRSGAFVVMDKTYHVSGEVVKVNSAEATQARRLDGTDAIDYGAQR